MKREQNIQILQELLNSVKERGYFKTLNLLKTEKLRKINLTNPYDKFIIETVSEAFSLTQSDLLFGRYMRGENKYAIGFCVYYLYENKSLGEIHRSIFKNRNITLLSKYRQIIFDLRTNNVMDKKFIAIKAELDKKIENFKKDNQ